MFSPENIDMPSINNNMQVENSPLNITIRDVDKIGPRDIHDIFHTWEKNVCSRISLYKEFFENVIQSRWATDHIMNDHGCSIEFFVHLECVNHHTTPPRILKAIELLQNDIERKRFSEIIKENYRIFTQFTVGKLHNVNQTGGPLHYNHTCDAHACLHIQFTLDVSV